MSIGRKSPEEKEADAAAMRARYAEKKRIERSIRMKAYHSQFDSAKAGSDLTKKSFDASVEKNEELLERLEDSPQIPQSSNSPLPIPPELAGLTLAARSQSDRISEKMKDHLQIASAIGAETLKERRAIGNGIAKGKVYKSASEVVRKFLEDGRKGAVNEKGQTRLIQIIENMVHIAKSGSPRAVHAYEALMARAYGKPKPSEESLDAMARGGVQLIYVAPPEIATSETKMLKPSPDFIDAEVIEND